MKMSMHCKTISRIYSNNLGVAALKETGEKRKELASKSLQHCSNDKQFGVLFPEIKEEIDENLKSGRWVCDLIEKIYVFCFGYFLCLVY